MKLLPKEDQIKLFHSIEDKRGKAKNTNFACQYNAFPPKIAVTAGISLNEAQHLFDVYWERNWALKEFTKTLQVKKVFGHKWVLNPVSKFWIYLKEEKDVFSTINQNTAKIMVLYIEIYK